MCWRYEGEPDTCNVAPAERGLSLRSKFRSFLNASRSFLVFQKAAVRLLRGPSPSTRSF